MSNVTALNQEINLYSKESIKNASGSRVLEISPDVAKLWLDKFNKANRPLADSFAKEYARRMAKGQWKLNGETIKFNDKGEMIDGQHRCKAIVFYGEPVEIECRFGLGDVFETIDEGKKRSPSDALAVRGIPNYTNAAAAIAFVLKHKMNLNSDAGASAKVSNRDVLDFYYKHESKIDSFVNLGSKLYDLSGRILSASEFAAYMFLFHEKHSEEAGKFLEKLALGANLSRKSSIFHLRAKLTQSKYDKQKRLNARVKKALVIKAWNYYRIGKEIKILKFDPSRQDFPKIA